MPRHQRLLLAVATTLFIAANGVYWYMRGPVNLVARPAPGSEAGYPILDGCGHGYSQKDVEDRLAAWTKEQIAIYREIHLGPDMLLPWLYNGFFFVAALLGFGRAFPGRCLWPALLVLPLLNLTADYTENYLISFVILPAGTLTDASAIAWASWSTRIKFILMGTNSAVVLLGIVLSACRRAHGKQP
jgi:hypothetical protein